LTTRVTGCIVGLLQWAAHTTPFPSVGRGCVAPGKDAVL
jgi:hypothetical protein